VELIPHYYRSGQHSYTRRSLADKNVLNSGSPDFQHQVKSQSFWILLRHYLVTLLITSIHLPYWHRQFITSYRTKNDYGVGK